MAKKRVLHILSQRPSLTGSGITLDALVRAAQLRGWDQAAVVGTPTNDADPEVGGLPQERIRPLVFDRGEVDFPLPGMSDVMPYRSSVFSKLNPDQIDRYERAWSEHLAEVIEEFKPDVIHSHHIWLMSALIKSVAPEIPVVTHCHATGLRQMSLCPHLKDKVYSGARRNDRFAVLHLGQKAQVCKTLGLPADRVKIVGAGYREDFFYPQKEKNSDQKGDHVLYAGKLSDSKGLPWLLDAVENLAPAHPSIRLHIAGGGDGPEADKLRDRITNLDTLVEYHGRLDQKNLADLMRKCAVFVLPSFYEGLPLVLVEALACGCRLVATNLPVVEHDLGHHLGSALETVPLPRLIGMDKPDPADLPDFVSALTRVLERSLKSPPVDHSNLTEVLGQFTWEAVFRRVERLWISVSE